MRNALQITTLTIAPMLCVCFCSFIAQAQGGSWDKANCAEDGGGGHPLKSICYMKLTALRSARVDLLTCYILMNKYDFATLPSYRLPLWQETTFASVSVAVCFATSDASLPRCRRAAQNLGADQIFQTSSKQHSILFGAPPLKAQN